jgi:hypothetical protein
VANREAHHSTQHSSGRLRGGGAEPVVHLCDQSIQARDGQLTDPKHAEPVPDVPLEPVPVLLRRIR